MPGRAVDQGRDGTRTYRSAFRRFHAATDEMDCLLEAYQHLVLVRQARSLLGIGAGDRTLAVPLARSVRTYVGVERDPMFVPCVAIIRGARR
jgi:hypothetical protein